jgi:hypothetical protein
LACCAASLWSHTVFSWTFAAAATLPVPILQPTPCILHSCLNACQTLCGWWQCCYAQQVHPGCYLLRSVRCGCISSDIRVADATPSPASKHKPYLRATRIHAPNTRCPQQTNKSHAAHLLMRLAAAPARALLPTAAARSAPAADCPTNACCASTQHCRQAQRSGCTC